MYVDYDTFDAMALAVLSEGEYARLAPLADAIIDHWTLERVGRAVRNEEELPAPVVSLYCAIVEALPPIIEGSKPGKGGLVTSFSNGIDSYSFDVSATAADQLWRSLGWMVDLLPVEWVSAAVAYEGGNGYAS